jgi:hypothetical protein
MGFFIVKEVVSCKSEKRLLDLLFCGVGGAFLGFINERGVMSLFRLWRDGARRLAVISLVCAADLYV